VRCSPSCANEARRIAPLGRDWRDRRHRPNWRHWRGHDKAGGPPANLLRCNAENRKVSGCREAEPVTPSVTTSRIPSGKAPNSALPSGLTLAGEGEVALRLPSTVQPRNRSAVRELASGNPPAGIRPTSCWPEGEGLYASFCRAFSGTSRNRRGGRITM
jgi:hypothetical protein